MNLVVPQNSMIWHAEMVALSTNQRMGTFSLSQIGARNITLASSCELCAMCMGTSQWAGLSDLSFGASGSDAEAIGFNEGFKPEEWQQKFRDAGTNVTQMLKANGRRVLMPYGRKAGRVIYNGKQPPVS